MLEERSSHELAAIKGGDVSAVDGLLGAADGQSQGRRCTPELVGDALDAAGVLEGDGYWDSLAGPICDAWSWQSAGHHQTMSDDADLEAAWGELHDAKPTLGLVG